MQHKTLCRALPEVASTIKPPQGADWDEGMVDVYGSYYAGGFKDMSKAAT
jgi:hypothetical protein